VEDFGATISAEPLWKWIKKIAALKAKKIVWDDSLNDPPNTHIFVFSVDGRHRLQILGEEAPNFAYQDEIFLPYM
jgi:hypothetical protein